MEKQKTDPILMVAAAIAIIATGYVLYNTVIESLLADGQGYVYAVIFGFILLVLFLLCNLFTKLIAISVGEQHSPYRKMICAGGLVLIAILFLVSRMRYSTELYPGEYPVYRGAVAMAEGTYSQSHDVIDSAIANPAQYLYSLILSVIFRFVEPGSTPVLWINAVFIILCGYLTYKIVKTFTNRMCGLFAAVLCAFIPSQTFAVYSFTSQPMVTAIYLGAVLALISLFSYNKRIKELRDAGDVPTKDIAATVFAVAGAVLIGLLLFVEPFMIIPTALMVLVAYLSRKMKALSMLVAFAAGIVIMFLLCFAKASHMGVDFGKVMQGQISAFDPSTDYNSGQEHEFSDVFGSFNTELATSDENIRDNYSYIYRENKGGAYTESSIQMVLVINEILYMFILVMTLSCMILAVKEQKDYVITISMLIVGAFLMLLFQQNREPQKFLFVTVFIIATATGIHYLYLDHHPELKVSVNALDALEKTGRKEIAAATRSNLKNAAQMNDAEFTKRAKALIFVGNDEELYRQIKDEEHERAQKYFSRPDKKAEEAFDDYDEDFFLDKEDDASDSVKVTAVAPSGTRQTVGGDEAYEPNAEMHEAASEALSNTSIPAWKRPEQFGDEVMFDEDDVELDKEHSSFEGRNALRPTEGLTTNEPVPEVEKITRNTKKIIAPPEPKKVKPLEINDELLEMPGFLDAKDTSSEPTPVIEVVSEDDTRPLTRAEAKARAKAEKAAKKAAKSAKSDKHPKLVTKPASTTMSGGKAVRRIKNVGGGAAAAVTVAAAVHEKPAVAAEPVNTEPVKKTEDIAPSKPIPNPLPVPKKKEHKALDYDKKTSSKSEDDWDFDFDVSDDDDWDV